MNPKYRITILNILILLLVSSGAALPTPEPLHQNISRQQSPLGEPSFGVNAHLATRYPDGATMDIPGSILTELGVSWVREDFHWYRIQPQADVWEWGFNDRAVRELIKRNINVLGVIGGPSAPWATPYPRDHDQYASFYAPDTDAFVRYAQAVVTRYRRYIHHWEIWNEPDNPHFWKPHPDPVAYATMLIKTSAAIKEVDPDAQVLIAGFNPFDTTFIRRVLDMGAWQSFDILAIHPYVDPLTPEEGNIRAAASNVRVLTDQYGQKPIWATEVGWSSGPGDNDPLGKTDSEEQANYLVRTMLLLWEAGIERSFWYTLKDDPGNPYGLMALGTGREDYRIRKPAFFAFRNLNRQLRGATFAERRDLFTKSVLLDFNSLQQAWHRPIQPNGMLQETSIGAARILYHFSTKQNDYVAFVAKEPVPLTGTPYALGVWVYGDGSGHGIQVWVRDAEGEVLQFRLGVAGAPGWQFISTPIVYPVNQGNRISGTGNGRVDFPASLYAVVLDDFRDSYVGTGMVYLDNLTLINGREVYDFRFTKGDEALDILWSPPGTRVSLKSSTRSGMLIERDGDKQGVMADEGKFSLQVTSKPIYLWHAR